jgi:chitin disaccharide deacetylase
MTGEKHLIVNADDFGQSPGVNRGIIAAHERGIVTSASLMTRWLAVGEAALYAKEHPELSVGLHLDLGEWTYREGNWLALYTVVPLDEIEAVTREIADQLATFRRLIGKNPTHIDSHQHVHLREPARSALFDVAHDLHVPIRQLSHEIHYCGNFYGQTVDGYPLPDHISFERLVEILARLPEGLTELGCHPGEANDLNTMYRKERSEEIKVLCDPRLQAAIRTLGIRLCSFDDWKYLNNACDQPSGG